MSIIIDCYKNGSSAGSVEMTNMGMQSDGICQAGQTAFCRAFPGIASMNMLARWVYAPVFAPGEKIGAIFLSSRVCQINDSGNVAVDHFG